MCHIGTWSTRYCMRTAENVWRSKVKKNMVYRVSKNETRQRSLFAEYQEKTLGKGLTAAAGR